MKILIKAINNRNVYQRDFRKEYIPGWNDKSDELYEHFPATGKQEELLHSLDAARCKIFSRKATQTER